MSIRLDKYLADMGLGTRKELKTAIRKSKVTVNGELVRNAGFILNGDEEVVFDGVPVRYETHEYYMLNKPAGVISATEDSRQETVIGLIPEPHRKDLFPVGRLDKDTVGLLIITDDGQLAHRLLAPKRHVDKIYYAEVSGIVTEHDVRRFAGGLKVDESLTALPAKLEILDPRPAEHEKKAGLASGQEYGPEAGDISRVKISIHEGKYHQIKRMFEAVEKTVVYLKRMEMGGIALDPALSEGESRPLTPEELEMILNC